ncbi:MAG: hypothetical protein LBT45_02700 [Rickettsiales bacterium]|jgi:hypothetical protein|nr:hypothetical protein [Rickettsiales bacterium]
MSKKKKDEWMDFVAGLPEGANASEEWKKCKEENARRERAEQLEFEEKQRLTRSEREAESGKAYAEALAKEEAERQAAEARRAGQALKDVAAAAVARELERKEKSNAAVKRLIIAAIALGIPVFAIWYIAIRPRNIAENGVVIYNPVTRKISIEDIRPGGTTFRRPDTGETVTVMSADESDFRKKNGENLDDKFLMGIPEESFVVMPAAAQKTR